MPRAPRQTAAGIYHVATRAQVGEQLFRDTADFIRFETELGRALDVEATRCIAACAMTTHYHLLLETGEGALPRLMQRLNQRYARAYNARYGRRGHAFAERYVSVPVLYDEQLLAAYRYIARNPVEASLCDSPGNWPWSSYPAAIGHGSRFGYADPELAIACCDGSLDRLRRFVESGA